MRDRLSSSYARQLHSARAALKDISSGCSKGKTGEVTTGRSGVPCCDADNGRLCSSPLESSRQALLDVPSIGGRSFACEPAFCRARKGTYCSSLRFGLDHRFFDGVARPSFCVGTRLVRRPRLKADGCVDRTVRQPTVACGGTGCHRCKSAADCRHSSVRVDRRHLVGKPRKADVRRSSLIADTCVSSSDCLRSFLPENTKGGSVAGAAFCQFRD